MHRDDAGFADEGEDEGRRRRVVDFVGRRGLFDLALAHDDDAVGKLKRFFLVVGDEQGGVAGAIVDFAQPAAEILPHAGVKRAEGFIEQEHAGLDGEGARECDALALAAGKLGREAALEARELDEVEQLQHAALDLGFLRLVLASGAQAESDIVHHPHVLEERIVLEHETDAAILDAAFIDVSRSLK